ncbi:MAG: LysR family transcriptional regulator [Pseudonocardiaceae bacterium]|nr:LysR family transcriptional regulator [Pseudonocardiaceae bacterium]
MDSRVSLHRLEVLCLVVDEGGVTRAAERLLVAQPAVSAQLRSLERSLGAALFARRGSQLALTEAGQRVYHWAKEVLAGSTQVQRDVDELAAGTAGSLVIAASMAIGSYLLPPVLTRLRAERPGADITIHVGQPTVALRATQLGEVDFAVVTWLDDEVPEGLDAEKLWDEPLVLCASPTGPPHTDSISVAEITRLPCVGVPTNTAYHRIVQNQLHNHGVGELDIVIRLGHAEPMKQAVAENGWVTIAPEYAVANDVSAGRLRLIEIRDARLVEGIGLYHRTAKYYSPLQRSAIDALRLARHHSDSHCR